MSVGRIIFSYGADVISTKKLHFGVPLYQVTFYEDRNFKRKFVLIIGSKVSTSSGVDVKLATATESFWPFLCQ